MSCDRGQPGYNPSQRALPQTDLVQDTARDCRTRRQRINRRAGIILDSEAVCIGLESKDNGLTQLLTGCDATEEILNMRDRSNDRRRRNRWDVR